jgi:enoyl-CoA hydratase
MRTADVVTLDRYNDEIALITLRRPEALNALSWKAMEAFRSSVEAAHRLPRLRALVVTGEGRAFCAGGDVYELHEYLSRSDGERLSELMGAALDRLAALPSPVIAAIEGPAIGGGAEIALACDLRVMAEDARLGLMHVRLAICTAWGGGQRLLRLVGYARSLEWLARGTILTAQAAQSAGLANAVVPAGQATLHALDLAGAIASNDPQAVRSVKSFLQAGLFRPPGEAAQFERQLFPDVWAATPHRLASEGLVNARRPKAASG